MKRKKIVSLSLAFAMTLGSAPVFAVDKLDSNIIKDDKTYISYNIHDVNLSEAKGKIGKATVFLNRGFVKGNEDGKLNIGNKITRAEFLTLLANVMNLQGQSIILGDNESKFNDVNIDYWANGVINLFSENSLDNGEFLISGYSDGSFKPNNKITYAEMAKMLVLLKDNNLTKEDVEKNNKNWPNAWVQIAKDSGIFEDVDVKSFNDEVPRIDAFTMLYNTMK